MPTSVYTNPDGLIYCIVQCAVLLNAFLVCEIEYLKSQKHWGFLASVVVLE